MTALAAAQVQSSSNAQNPASTQAATAQPATAPGTQASSGTDAASGQAAAKLANPTAAETAKLLGPAVKSLQDYIKPQQTATIQVDHATGQSFVKIINAQTKQLVLQIPSAQVLAMAHKLQQMDNPQAASGVLVDQEG
jgi:flagellar protein FlaG